MAAGVTSMAGESGGKSFHACFFAGRCVSHKNDLPSICCFQEFFLNWIFAEHSIPRSCRAGACFLPVNPAMSIR